ncbi:MAG: hypothetical protein AB1297_05070 [bacterium]
MVRIYKYAKTYKVELCVSSKLYDLVSKSAKLTLWEMGYKGLSDLSREIYFSFDILAKDNNEAERIVSEMVKKTSLFVNPNKDTYRVTSHKPQVTSRGQEVNVLVWYREDKRDGIIKNQLKREGWNRVLNVSQGELWHFFIEGERKKELVKEMVELKSTSSGLLTNPHSQRYKIFVGV